MHSIMIRLYFCLSMVLFMLPVFSMPAVIFEANSGTSKADKLIAMAVAGIVNRDKPQLYLRNVYETWSFDQTDEVWEQYYTDEGANFNTLITDTRDLVNYFKSFIKGAIIYNPNLTASNFSGQSFMWQGEFAAMLCGLTDCIPLPNNYSKIDFDIPFPETIFLTNQFNSQTKSVGTDLTSSVHTWNSPMISNPMNRYLLLLQWGTDEILPYTNPGCFYVREITDWTIQQRMFQINLAGTEDLRFESLSDEKALVFEKVMIYMNQKRSGKIFHVYGWIRPEPLVQWISSWGGSFHETLLGNLSWHHIFPVTNPVFKHASTLNANDVKLEDKFYILIVGSEGDAANWHIGLQSGAWLSTVRSQIPLAWGFNLHLFDQFPSIAKYYCQTASSNDGFVAVTAPLGYSYSDMYSGGFYDDAVAESKRLIEKFGIETLYAYKHYNGIGISTFRGKTISNSYDFEKLGRFNDDIGIKLCMLMDPKLSTQTAYTGYGNLLLNHVNDGTFYGESNQEGKLSSRILQLLGSKWKPGFLIAGYQRLRQDDFNKRTSPGSSDISLPMLKREMEIVKNDPFYGKYVEFVTPEKFTILLRKSLNLSTGIGSEMIQPINTLQFYCNHGVLHLKSNYITSSAMVEIYNMSGQLMGRFPQVLNGMEELKISINNYPAGLYVVAVKGDKFLKTGRFLKF